jgi:hypothetical protein
MRRKSHVSFLGEDATVTSRPYPTKRRAIEYSLWAWGYMDSMIAGIQAGPKLPVSLAWSTVSPIRRPPRKIGNGR